MAACYQYIQFIIAKDTAQLHIPCHCENEGGRFIVLLVVNNIIIYVIMLCRCTSHRSPHHCIYDMHALLEHMSSTIPLVTTSK